MRKRQASQETGIYDTRYHLEQMVLHYFYREGMKQKEIAKIVGVSKGITHTICNTVELKSKPDSPLLKKYVFSLEEMPRLGDNHAAI